MQSTQLKNSLSIKNILGQGMTEYIIIVALVAVAAIGAFKLFGETARNQVAGLATELAGQDAADSTEAAEDAAESAAEEAGTNRGMGNYNGVNSVGNQ